MMPALILIMSFFGMVILPAQNWFSRRLEREADRYAIQMTASPETFVSVMKKLAKMNLSDPDPPLVRKIIIYNHPPISERIRMAEQMAQEIMMEETGNWVKVTKPVSVAFIGDVTPTEQRYGHRNPNPMT